jgi:SpoVK/Ycf46/Vps4 family AAA+-type ATPase
LSDFISESTWSKSHQIIERLVIATNKDRFVRAGETIRSSFQGKSVELRVLSVAGASNKKGVSRLMEDLSDLKISRDDKTKDTPFVVDLRTALCRKPDKLALFRITTATRVSTQLTGYILPEQQDIPEHNRLVAGLDSTIERLKDLLLPALLRPELFLEGSLKPPRGALLYGPSGTGKSLLAKQLGMDISRNVRVEFVNCTTLQSHTALVGEAERKLTQLFRRLQNQPSEGPTNVLLILDDVHLICPKRDGRNPGVDRLAATLLALLDGIGSTTTDRAESSGNLVVLAITTNPSLLDPALRRPGRLDAEVEVPIPDELTRAAILKFQLDAFRQDADVPELDDSEVLALSRLAKGFNGADCMLAIKEAIRCSVAQSPASTKANPKVMLEDLQSAIRSTKPSSITSITVEIPQVHWSSIGGMDSVKQQLREAIELPITHAHLFEALSIPPPRGVLLYGPPGCSKTLMARALATEGQMNFLAVKGPELLSKWLGESERALASLFRRARMASPCIIFFDEIDAIAAKRGGSDGNAGGERLLSQLLTELDGVRNTTGKSGSVDKERIVVVGATNRPDLLDSALMRPGRMDRKIYVGLPDEQSRRRIFEIGLKDKACSDDVVVSCHQGRNLVWPAECHLSHSVHPLIFYHTGL